MILVDTNVLLYVYNASSTLHKRVRAWVDEAFSRGEQIVLPWIVILVLSA